MADSAIRLLIHGASGRMGRALLRLAPASGLQVVAAVSRDGGPIAEAGDVTMLPASRISEAPEFDIAIDFSLPEAFDACLSMCRSRGRGLVTGTTGLSPAQWQQLDGADLGIPLVWASNFSTGVAVLAELVRQAAAAVPGWDADIIEAHHVHKKDAPSGTALSLGAAVTAGRGGAPNYASLRAGDIVGEHTVQFTGIGERLELVHRATHRDIFALGALDAARRLARLGPGRHDYGALLLAKGPG